jgi:hypothetical protein
MMIAASIPSKSAQSAIAAELQKAHERPRAFCRHILLSYFVVIMSARDACSTAHVQERYSEMTPSSGIRTVYDPDTLNIMTNAFDRACEFLPVQLRDSDRMRRKLALHIVRHVNDGESDPTRLADSAILSVLR